MAKATERLSIEETLKKLDKQFGKGAVIYGDELDPVDGVISTGSLGLDIATGIGGIPISTSGNNGKIVEIYGWESSGKSTLVQTIIGNAQKQGIKCLMTDGENSIDDKYSKKLGINLKELLLIQLDEGAGEAAYDKMFALVETGEIGLAIVDSYNSLQPKKIVDGDIDEQTMGLHARMLGKVVMKCNSYCSKYGTTFVFIGQLREKIGVMWGSPETTQGGNSLRFYSHMRMEVSRSTTNDNSTLGADGFKDSNLHKVNIIKNKMAPPFKKAEFFIRYGQGIEKEKELLNLAHKYNVGKKYGDSFTYDGVKYTIKDFLTALENSELFDKIRKEVLINSKTETIDESTD